MYSPMTAIEVTAPYAMMLFSAGLARMSEQPTHSQIELVGVPVRAFTLAQSRSRQRTVPREGVRHTGVRGHRRHTAEELGDRADEQQEQADGPPAASMKIWAGGSPVGLSRSAS